jgi:hypothetical protein
MIFIIILILGIAGALALAGGGKALWDIRKMKKRIDALEKRGGGGVTMMYPAPMTYPTSTRVSAVAETPTRKPIMDTPTMPNESRSLFRRSRGIPHTEETDLMAGERDRLLSSIP